MAVTSKVLQTDTVIHIRFKYLDLVLSLYKQVLMVASLSPLFLMRTFAFCYYYGMAAWIFFLFFFNVNYHSLGARTYSSAQK